MLVVTFYGSFTPRSSPPSNWSRGGHRNRRVLTKTMYDVSFGERERKIHRDPTGNRTQDFPITRRTLLPLSHWTHSRGTEASLLITAMLEASANFSCLSLSLTVGNTIEFLSGDPWQMGLRGWGVPTVRERKTAEVG